MRLDVEYRLGTNAVLSRFEATAAPRAGDYWQHAKALYIVDSVIWIYSPAGALAVVIVAPSGLPCIDYPATSPYR